ncbi:uncharacterized protein LOC116921615 [Daphnia magna]|uniref:uncharacterized protein LOC116921615 n=1 Tax=Daphnia magna TaxID=35525 RepID=UPI001E1BCA1E|nr:uncharacterized protein LOC116921615 [Daphnia magna]
MWQQQLVSNGISQWKTTHSFLRMVLSLSMLIFSGQLEGFLFFTELYHFHGILNCLSADCHLASLEWYGPYQQCYDALLKYTNPSENIRIEIMEISALHAELHNDGFAIVMDLKRILMEFWYKKVHVRWKGTEEFRILLLSHMLWYFYKNH